MRRRSASLDGRHVSSALRQLIFGLAALPLSVLPFVAYASFTPEGRLVRDRVVVAVAPPRLPALSRSASATAAARGPRYQGRVVVLAYHGIGSTPDGEGTFVISPRRFGEHLAVLRAAGMHTVTAAQVARAFNGGPPLPANAVMISFDDGRTDAMLFADPLLKRAHMSATMFVITGAASHPGVYYAPWKRIDAYARSGRWDIQAHTSTSHREWRAAGGGKLPVLTSLAPGEGLSAYRTRVRADLAAADAAIRAHTGRRPVAFAYPFGAYGADRHNDPRIEGVLRDEVARRYDLAFHQDGQDDIPLVAPDQDRVRLRRLQVKGWSGLELLDHIARAQRNSPVLTSVAPPADVPVDPAALVPPASPVTEAVPPPTLPEVVRIPTTLPNVRGVLSGVGLLDYVPSTPPPASLPITTTTTIVKRVNCQHPRSDRGTKTCPLGRSR